MATDIESGIVSDSHAFGHEYQHNKENGLQAERAKRELRAFKKSSANGKITIYLGKRDFVDHMSYVDPIDGVILIDKEYVKGKKVFGHVLATFRYGRDDLDVLGLNFRKELYLVTEQIYPDPNRHHPNEACPYFIKGASYQTNNDSIPVDPSSISSGIIASAQKEPQRLTKLQERLVKKLGSNAFPFFFELEPLCPSSVTLQPGPGDSGKPCGVDYELKAYIANSLEDKPSKRDSIQLAIRKIMYAPSKQGKQPIVEISKDFVMSPNKLNLEVSLDKELYHHGESIAVNVHVSNNSNRTVKKVKVSVRQHADICLFSSAQYKCTVAELESEEGCPVGPGSTLSKVYYLRPLLASNKHKRGLALDGQIKHEDTNLASSTLVSENNQKENLGIIVQYKVRVKLALGALGGDLVAELPVTLMHQKQDDDETENQQDDNVTLSEHRTLPYASYFGRNSACKCVRLKQGLPRSNESQDNTDSNTVEQKSEEEDLIQLDVTDNDNDNDIIFEDFARLRLEQTEDFSSSNKDSVDGFPSSYVPSSSQDD